MLKRLAIVGTLAFAAPAVAEMIELCPGGAIWRDTITDTWSCGPSTAMPTPQAIPTPIPTAWPTPNAGSVAPTPQPTFAYTAPTPQPTKALDPTAASASYDFAATTSNACINGPSTITVTGAVDGDACIVGVPAAAIGTGVTYHCHGACKLGTTTFNPPAGNFTVRIVRP